MNTQYDLAIESFIEYLDGMEIVEEKFFKPSKKPGNQANISEEEISFTHEKASGKVFDSLVKSEALCAEGLKNPNQKEACELLRKVMVKYANEHQIRLPNQMHFYWCTGKDINSYYHLTGDNRYNNSLGFFFLDWSNWHDTPPKFRFRWFSDVVDNNARKEILKGNPHYKNYHSIYGDEWFYKTVEEGRNNN